MYRYYVYTSIPILGMTSRYYLSMGEAMRASKYFISVFGCGVNIKQEKVLQ